MIKYPYPNKYFLATISMLLTLIRNVVLSVAKQCWSEKTQHIMTQIARFMWPTWGPPGSCRPQVGRILVRWTLLSGNYSINTPTSSRECYILFCYSFILMFVFFKHPWNIFNSCPCSLVIDTSATCGCSLNHFEITRVSNWLFGVFILSINEKGMIHRTGRC